MSYRKSFHKRLVEATTALMEQRLAEQGQTELRADQVDRLTEAFEEAATRSAEQLVTTLKEDAPAMHQDHTAVWADVERELREIWGQAIDDYYQVVVCVDEAGREFVNDLLPRAHEEDDVRFVALAGLMAQGARTGLEVWHLIRLGFAAGATARARTLHEINVTAQLLAEHGLELSRCYLDHIAVDQLDYMRHLPDDQLSDRDRRVTRELEQRVQHLVERHGPAFGRPNGWACHLVAGAKAAPSFRKLEELAELDHWRPLYKEGSQAIHPTSWSALVNMEQGGMVTSWRMTGLADPANAALTSLTHLLSTVLLAADLENQADLLYVNTVRQLADEVQETMVEAEAAAQDLVATRPVHPEPRDK